MVGNSMVGWEEAKMVTLKKGGKRRRRRTW